MIKKSLTNQILISIMLILTISCTIFYITTYNKIEDKIDKDQSYLYNKSIQTKIFLLEEKYNRLQNTGLVESYEKSFKEGIITLFRKMYYDKNLDIYPFIIDAKEGVYRLHPKHSSQNKKVYEKSIVFNKSIEIKSGEFILENHEINEWVIIQHFEEWDWIVGYSVPFDIKYNTLYTFQSNFIFISISLFFLVSIVVWLSIRKLLTPVNKLIIETKKIKEGDLNSKISIDANYELSELANNFISMRNSIKSNISELNKTKELLKNIIDNAPIRIFWKDKEGKFLGANKLFLEDFGNIELDELLGKTDMDFGMKESKSYMDDDAQIINENKSKLNFIETQTFADKSERILSTSKVPLRNSKGEVMGILGVYNDITQRVQMREELKQKEIFILEQAKLASMGEMIGNIAHQWRQPLSTISTVATGMELQKEAGILSDEMFIDSIEQINNSVQYLSKTIDDFRNFCNPNSLKTEFFISHTIESVLKLVSTQYINHNITVIKEIEDYKMLGYENEMVQVIINILNNAKDELENKENQKRLIIVSTQETEDQFLIKIKDNAGGIPDDILNRVFEPYFTTKHKSQGTGIGLYMCEEIISKHMKGILSAKNETYTIDDIEYAGAEFTIAINKKS